MLCEDLACLSALSTRLDLEDFQDRYGRYHGCARSLPGMKALSRVMGEQVLAYFGYPQAHEDIAEQATRAGLMLVDAVASTARTQPPSCRFALASRPVWCRGRLDGRRNRLRG